MGAGLLAGKPGRTGLNFIGQVNLPLSGALQANNKWMNRRTYSIEGDIEPRGKAFLIHVQITPTADRSQIFNWDLTTSDEGSAAEQLHPAAEEVAYRLVIYLCQQQVQAHSWRSLKLFIQGLQQMQQGQDAGIHPELLEIGKIVRLNCCGKLKIPSRRRRRRV